MHVRGHLFQAAVDFDQVEVESEKTIIVEKRLSTTVVKNESTLGRQHLGTCETRTRCFWPLEIGLIEILDSHLE